MELLVVLLSVVVFGSSKGLSSTMAVCLSLCSNISKNEGSRPCCQKGVWGYYGLHIDIFRGMIEGWLWVVKAYYTINVKAKDVLLTTG